MPNQLAKKELLCPAGDYESFLAALNNGADAIYLSGTSFGARAYAKNFTLEELKKAIDMGHLYGVKVYVTMNTMIKEKETSHFLEQVEQLYKWGVDAILMQDIGMICLCREKYPDLEIHASTQANCSSEDALRLFEKIGVKRVVFPREMSLQEIASIKTPLEKEVFIHGALCVSYSGNCLFSFLNGGRSANRGECAGSCRMFYRLLQGKEKVKEGYLLSMKELHTAPSFKSLLDSDIVSLKIEGRMKSKAYVSAVTRYYRKLLDGLLPTDKDLDELKILFFREFTKGHLFDEADLINSKSPNHVGLLIGEVCKVTPKKIYVRLSDTLYQEDGIRFQNSKKGMMVNFLYDEKDALTSKVEQGKIAILENKIGLKEKDMVYKTSSSHLQKSLENIPRRRVKVNLVLSAKKGDKLKLIMSDFTNQVVVEGNVVEQAKTSKMTKEELEKLLTRLSDTPFVEDNVTIDMSSDIFIRVGEVNALRREAVEKLIAKRTEVLERPIHEVTFEKQTRQIKKPMHTLYARNQDALKNVDLEKFSRIYLENGNMNDIKIYQVRPRNEWKFSSSDERIFTEEAILTPAPKIGGYSLNVANSYSVYYLTKLNYQSVTLSIELSNQELDELLLGVKEKFGALPMEMVVKGRVDAMVILGNPLKLQENESYTLQDDKKNNYPIYYDGRLTIIQGKEEINREDEIAKWFSKGITSFCQIFS